MIESIKEGIYFNLPIELYHQDTALSKTSVMNLLTSPLDYWVNSSFNPNYTVQKKSKSLDFGKLVDKLLFEKEDFKNHYRVTGESDFGNYSKISVSRTDYNKAISAINELWSVKYCKHILSNGYSQVSIFFKEKESGLMLKSRPDYLKTNIATDYKTIKNISKQSRISQIVDYGYAIQNSIGVAAIAEAKQRLKAKDKTFGVYGANENQLAWLKDFAKEEVTEYRFIFQRNSSPFPFAIDYLDEDILNKGWQILKKAISIYQENFNAYGPNRWPGGKNKATAITLYEMSKKFSLMAEEE